MVATFGAHAVAVATGYSYGIEELLASAPETVLTDLSDTQQFMCTLEQFMRTQARIFTCCVITTHCEAAKRPPDSAPQPPAGGIAGQ